MDKLILIFKEIFDNKNLVIDSTTTADDVDGWDSLANIRLIIAIEKAFAIRFLAKELSELENVGQLHQLISKKTI